MDKSASIAVIIPALNEERAIAKVIDDLPAELVGQLIVVDNGSADKTGEIAARRGATVVSEPRRGYGQACLAGLAALEDPDIVVFLDGDYSDHPDELPRLVAPILEDRADLVIGSRARGRRERGALPPQARFGNLLATILIRALFGVRFTDLGPFRAIDYQLLRQLKMVDRDYGWTVEMQIKAARCGLRCVEVPVSYRRRIGVSKISGTLIGSVKAGYKITWTIFRYAALSR
jgi:glycosyltransferase involved in cell wall biosynthesis